MSLLYSRDDASFGSRPSGENVPETAHSAEALDEWHPMKGPGGLDAILLLARRTLVPSNTDLAGLVGRLPPSPLHHELEFAVRGFDEGQPIAASYIGQHRGIGEEPDKNDEPLLHLMELLKVKGAFDVIKAVRFAYQGE
jgi:hypothetical protein